MGSVTAVREHDILAFLGLAFAWSWGVWLLGTAIGLTGSRWLTAVVAWGPLIAAATVTAFSGGEVRAWARQIVPKPAVRARWYLFAVTVPFLLTQPGPLLAWAVGNPVSLVDPQGVIAEFLFVLFLAGALEEPGWRGFLQPRLQQRWSALTAALVVGGCWALWHVPMIVGGGPGYQGDEWVAFFIFLPVFSVLLAWIYNSTRGGLLFAMLFHAVINATPIIETTEPVAGGLSQLVTLLGLPLLVVAYYGRSTLAAAMPEPPVPGR